MSDRVQGQQEEAAAAREAGVHHSVWYFEFSSLPDSLVGQRTFYLLILNLEEKGVPFRSNYRSGQGARE